MFAIAFDLTVAEADSHHAKGYKGAYTDIRRTVGKHGFKWVQGSVYMSESDNLADIASVTEALKAMPWFPLSIRDIRVFRVENWSDFTPFMKTKI